MEALQDKRVRLQPECKKRLQDRIDMWNYAAKVNKTHAQTYQQDVTSLPKHSHLSPFKTSANLPNITTALFNACTFFVMN